MAASYHILIKKYLNMQQVSERPEIPDNRLFYKLNLAQRILLKYVDREFSNRLGVTAAQIAALFYLEKHDGCLFKDLSGVLLQNKSAITTLVERMQKNGLIEKKKSETDGRASHIYLTDKGRDISEKVRPLVSQYNRELLERFSDAEIEVIHRFFDTIIATYR